MIKIISVVNQKGRHYSPFLKIHPLKTKNFLARIAKIGLP